MKQAEVTSLSTFLTNKKHVLHGVFFLYNSSNKLELKQNLALSERHPNNVFSITKNAVKSALNVTIYQNQFTLQQSLFVGI